MVSGLGVPFLVWKFLKASGVRFWGSNFQSASPVVVGRGDSTGFLPFWSQILFSASPPPPYPPPPPPCFLADGICHQDLGFAAGICMLCRSSSSPPMLLRLALLRSAVLLWVILVLACSSSSNFFVVMPVKFSFGAEIFSLVAGGSLLLGRACSSFYFVPVSALFVQVVVCLLFVGSFGMSYSLFRSDWSFAVLGSKLLKPSSVKDLLTVWDLTCLVVIVCELSFESLIVIKSKSLKPITISDSLVSRTITWGLLFLVSFLAMFGISTLRGLWSVVMFFWSVIMFFCSN